MHDILNEKMPKQGMGMGIKVKHGKVGIPIEDLKLYRVSGLKVYRLEAWVHPRSGGSDYIVEKDIHAKDLKEAKEMARKFLKAEGSAILDDFKLKGKM